MFQGAATILSLGLCPATLLPSTACESVHPCLGPVTGPGHVLMLLLLLPAVTRRCFPSLGQSGGVITVGNSTQFDDGSGNMVDAKNLLAGVS